MRMFGDMDRDMAPLAPLRLRQSHPIGGRVGKSGGWQCHGPDIWTFLLFKSDGNPKPSFLGVITHILRV